MFYDPSKEEDEEKSVADPEADNQKAKQQAIKSMQSAAGADDSGDEGGPAPKDEDTGMGNLFNMPRKRKKSGGGGGGGGGMGGMMGGGGGGGGMDMSSIMGMMG